MKTIMTLLLTVLAFGLTACPAVEKASITSAAVTNFSSSYTPIDPYPSPLASDYDDNGKLVSLPWAKLSNEKTRNLLPNEQAEISMRKIDAQGKIGYLSGSITAEGGEYIVTLDYMKYLVDELTDKKTGNNLGLARIGVGLRLTAKILTIKSNIELGSLFALGFAAKQGYLSGSLKVDAIGLSSPEITYLFPTPSTIDETSIQKSLEAIAVIKSKLSDSITRLTPQIVAIRLNDSTYDAMFEMYKRNIIKSARN